MSYVKPLDQTSAQESAKPILAAIEKRFGQSLGIFNVMAHQPTVLEGVVKVNEGVHKSLPGKLRELAYVISSRINNCEYCSHHHSKAASQEGVSDDQLDRILEFADSSLFTDEEKTVLQYAQQLTKSGDVESSVVDRLKEFLNDEQLVVLASTVALANFTNRFNHGLGVELP